MSYVYERPSLSSNRAQLIWLQVNVGSMGYGFDNEMYTGLKVHMSLAM